LFQNRLLRFKDLHKLRSLLFQEVNLGDLAQVKGVDKAGVLFEAPLVELLDFKSCGMTATLTSKGSVPQEDFLFNYDFSVTLSYLFVR